MGIAGPFYARSRWVAFSSSQMARFGAGIYSAHTSVPGCSFLSFALFLFVAAKIHSANRVFLHRAEMHTNTLECVGSVALSYGMTKRLAMMSRLCLEQFESRETNVSFFHGTCLPVKQASNFSKHVLYTLVIMIGGGGVFLAQVCTGSTQCTRDFRRTGLGLGSSDPKLYSSHSVRPRLKKTWHA